MSVYHEDPQENTDPDAVAPDGRDWGYVIAHAKDWRWSELTGNCGGCGNHDCHSGEVCPCNSDGYCLTCPTRRATGEVRGDR